jgi:site-specific DNA-adenine methylase
MGEEVGNVSECLPEWENRPRFIEIFVGVGATSP